MSQLWKLVTLFALIATLPSPIQASPTDPYDQPARASAPETQNDNLLSPQYYSPYSSYEDDLSPESQYPYDEEEDMAPEYQYPSPQAYAPELEEDYPYAENPSLSPSQASYLDILAPDAEDIDEELYYSPYEAPSPTESKYSGLSDTATGIAPQEAHAPPPVLPFNYSAEDDTSEFSEDYDKESYPEEKKSRAVIGFVMGAICLVGLGGLVYKKRKNQKPKHPMYVQLSKRGEV